MSSELKKVQEELKKAGLIEDMITGAIKTFYIKSPVQMEYERRIEAERKLEETEELRELAKGIFLDMQSFLRKVKNIDLSTQAGMEKVKKIQHDAAKYLLLIKAAGVFYENE